MLETLLYTNRNWHDSCLDLTWQEVRDLTPDWKAARATTTGLSTSRSLGIEPEKELLPMPEGPAKEQQEEAVEGTEDEGTTEEVLQLLDANDDETETAELLNDELYSGDDNSSGEEEKLDDLDISDEDDEVESNDSAT
jgi:hypothetical protein